MAQGARAASSDGAGVILLIDNYDSFVHNLARYLQRLGHETVVMRNDAIDAAEVKKLAPAAIVLSPGPCSPAQSGNSLSIARQLQAEVPMLGVCLGHQILAAVSGARIVRAPAPVHGQSSLIVHNGAGVFQSIASPMQVGRYHSLIVDAETLPSCWQVTAHCGDVIMAMQHQTLPLYGVQFHPESILTPQGYDLLANFLRMAGLEVPACVPALELKQPAAPRKIKPGRPATF